MSYPNERDCEHGQLRRACQLCELIAERDELRKLAYIGEHMHYDYSWKARFAEIKTERDALAAKFAEEQQANNDIRDVLEQVKAERGDYKRLSDKYSDLWRTERDRADALAEALRMLESTCGSVLMDTEHPIRVYAREVLQKAEGES